MTPLLFTNARVFDGENAECAEGMSVLVADGRIAEVSARPIAASGARVIDVAGRTLMPGMIDAHVHAYASDVSVQRIEAMGAAYRAAHGVRMLGHALDCGFTTVRDVGGGDHSLSRAIADGLVRAPRYFYAGKILSMTGGHGDMRTLEQRAPDDGGCACGTVNSFARMADGVDACIRGAREELRQGAHCIKIMGSGGVASPTDPDLDEPVPRGRDPRDRPGGARAAQLRRRRTAIPRAPSAAAWSSGCARSSTAR